MAKFPKPTKEKYDVVYYGLSSNDSSLMDYTNCLKAIGMFADVRISTNLLSDGYIIAFDMKNVTTSHLPRLKIDGLRFMSIYFQVF